MTCNSAIASDVIDDTTRQIDKFVASTIMSSFDTASPDDLNYSIRYPSETILAKPCDQELQFEWRKPLEAGSNTLEIKCNQPLFIGYGRIDLAVFKNVVVSEQPLARNKPLERSQLSLQRLDVSQLRHGYFEDLDQLDGYIVQRTVRVGQVITPFIVKAPSLVKRGDWVTIISGKGPLTVTSTGEALKDGVLGEQISVKNLKTDAKLKAWIIRKGVVSTKQSDL